MELWELIARESIRDRIARWNCERRRRSDGATWCMVLAPDVEFQAVRKAT